MTQPQTSFDVDAAAQQLIALMAADSTSGREEPAINAAETIAARLGFASMRLPAAPGRDNLLVTPTPFTPETAPTLVLCTHLDTVPPYIAPRLEPGVVHGRGACDAKGAAIAMIYALARARLTLGRDPRAACLFVVGEETDHVGARAFAASPLFSPQHIILGEPCGVRPAAGQKGLIKLRLTRTGKAAHSAFPELGDSAVHGLIRALDRLLAAPLPADHGAGETTLNIGQVSGGIAANVFAPEAEALVLIRCATSTDSIERTVRAALGPDITATILNRVEPRRFGVLGQKPGDTVSFNTDANELAPLGAELYLLGPGDMRCAHGPHELLTLTDLEAGIAAYAEIVCALA